MTLLSDQDLLRALDAGDLVVEPWLADQINDEPSAPSPLQPASLEVTLADTFLVPARDPITRAVDPTQGGDGLFRDPVVVPAGMCMALPPGGFLLGSTREKFTLSPTVAAQLSGKSSLGRLGLQVHSTAGFIDPGFSGHITLEFSNHGFWNLQLFPGMRIGQLLVFRLSSPADRPYGSTWSLGSRYQGQNGPTAPRRQRAVTGDVVTYDAESSSSSS